MYINPSKGISFYNILKLSNTFVGKVWESILSKEEIYSIIVTMKPFNIIKGYSEPKEIPI